MDDVQCSIESDSINSVSRREVVWGVASASILGAAGCLGENEDSDSNTGPQVPNVGDDTESDGEDSELNEPEQPLQYPDGYGSDGVESRASAISMLIESSRRKNHTLTTESELTTESGEVTWRREGVYKREPEVSRASTEFESEGPDEDEDVVIISENNDIYYPESDQEMATNNERMAVDRVFEPVGQEVDKLLLWFDFANPSETESGNIRYQVVGIKSPDEVPVAQGNTSGEFVIRPDGIPVSASVKIQENDSTVFSHTIGMSQYQNTSVSSPEMG